MTGRFTDPLYALWADAADQLNSGSYDREAIVRATGTEPDDFLPMELEIASTLGETIAKAGKKILPTIEATLGVGFSVDRLVDAIKAVNPEMSDLFVGSTANKVLASLQRAVKAGARLSGSASILDDVPSKADVLDGMLRAAKYTTNNYFNQQVVPKLFEQIDGIISGNTATTDEAFYAIKAAMEARLKSVPYWRTVANGAASRAYHYGTMKAGQMSGRRAYRLKAIRDRRTTKICLNLDGKEFWIADGLAQAERLAAVEPSELRTVAPWLKEADVVGKDANALRDANALLPPFHASCRTTIQYI